PREAPPLDLGAGRLVADDAERPQGREAERREELATEAGAEVARQVAGLPHRELRRGGHGRPGCPLGAEAEAPTAHTPGPAGTASVGSTITAPRPSRATGRARTSGFGVVPAVQISVREATSSSGSSTTPGRAPRTRVFSLKVTPRAAMRSRA